ncbi:uncharacterized protein LOC117298945 [Asterias rubens]|uniref:uncharacterized protein LOC117298945 n=1 Tax=Asterias rubens TaxID=7604 RepID=UPI000FECC750|nr:uncharacterized protein LOC117298945 [Asterias rubens]
MALRILAILTVLTLVLTSWVGTAEAVSGTTIANKAKAYANAGRTDWTFAAAHPDAGGFFSDGRNTNKCNLFVADVLEAVGATVPHRNWGFSGPIGAGEWGSSSSSYLTSASCWEYRSSSCTGCVIGDGRHVGIVTGWRETTSATDTQLVSNDWGFRASGSGSSSSITAFWKYVC